MLKKLGFVSLLAVASVVVGALFTLLITSIDPERDFLSWTIGLGILLFIICLMALSNKIAVGKAQELLFFFSSTLLMSFSIAFIIYGLIKANFKFAHLVWWDFISNIMEERDYIYYGISFLLWLVILIFYTTFIDSSLLSFTKSGLRGSGKLKQIDSNLENSRWMNDAEKAANFKSYKYSELGKTKKDGIPVAAELTKKNKDMNVSFNSPCHSIIIGSTGSGKTTTFVSPMIQLLGATAAGSSMIVTDPKGELFGLHSKFLKSRGYDVKVIDLRDTYSSYRWNPLDVIWDTYQDYLFAYTKAYERTDEVEKSNLKLTAPVERYDEVEKWYEFDGAAYADYDRLVEGINVYKKKKFDETYEDLNDLVSVLIPVENANDPMWEKGARSIVLAVLLAMLEDSANEELHMTKEKFNFFNMTKILQNSNDDYLELKNYFAGRSVLSKALSLSKQVCDCAESTRASYMSIAYEKLTMFNDAGICALTSASDFSSEQLAHTPTALFLKIPDEKDTRHNLAAIFILNIYKTLIKVASATEELTLERNVYFIMDEFGNMPKIEKFDKFITVGRSRKIWFTMIIQSYAQLNNVYGQNVADIVKGNCGIKMFIGSNDMGTCKEYSELCGNITVVTTSTSGSASSKDLSISSQTQVRPLIYPSELQRLNHQGDIGHSIIVTFGNFPLKTYFSPSFKVPFYKMGKMDTSDTERFFDESKILYEAKERNNKILGNSEDGGNAQGGAEMEQAQQMPMNDQSDFVQSQNSDGSASIARITPAQVEVSKEELANNKELEFKLMAQQYAKYMAEHQGATLADFYQDMAKLN